MKKKNFITILCIFCAVSLDVFAGLDVVSNPVLRLRPTPVVSVEENYWEHNPFDFRESIKDGLQDSGNGQEILAQVEERIGRLVWAGVVYPGSEDSGLVVLRDRLWRTGEEIDVDDYRLRLMFVKDRVVGIKIESVEGEGSYEMEYPIPFLLTGKYQRLGGDG